MKKPCQVCKKPSYTGVYIKEDDKHKLPFFTARLCYKHLIVALYDMAGKFENLDGIRLEFEN